MVRVFEISGNKLKLTDDYFFQNGSVFKWTGSNSFVSFDMCATNTNFNLKLMTASKASPTALTILEKQLLHMILIKIQFLEVLI